MTDQWRIFSSDLFRDHPCSRADTGTLLATGAERLIAGLRRRRPQTTCPPNTEASRRIETDLIAVVDDELAELGYVYESTGSPAPTLWCLGGPEVLIRPDDEHDYDDGSCVDLTTFACEQHKVIDVNLWPHSMSDHTLAGGDWPDIQDEFRELLRAFLHSELHSSHIEIGPT